MTVEIRSDVWHREFLTESDCEFQVSSFEFSSFGLESDCEAVFGRLALDWSDCEITFGVVWHKDRFLAVYEPIMCV